MLYSLQVVNKTSYTFLESEIFLVVVYLIQDLIDMGIIPFFQFILLIFAINYEHLYPMYNSILISNFQPSHMAIPPNFERNVRLFQQAKYLDILNICDPNRTRGTELEFIEKQPNLRIQQGNVLTEEQNHRFMNFTDRSCGMDPVPGRRKAMTLGSRRLVFLSVPTITRGRVRKFNLPVRYFEEFIQDLLEGNHPSVEYEFHRRRRNKSGRTVELVSPNIDVTGTPMQDIILEAKNIGVFVKLGGMQTVNIDKTGGFMRKKRTEHYGKLHSIHAYEIAAPDEMPLQQALVLLASLEKPILDQIPNLKVHFLLNGTMLVRKTAKGIHVS